MSEKNKFGHKKFGGFLGKHVKVIEDAKEKRDFLNKMTIPFMVVDTEFNVRFINNAAADNLGKIPETCIGQKCYVLFNTKECYTQNCQIVRTLHENRGSAGEVVAGRPSDKFPGGYKVFPLKDAQSDLSGAIEYIVDISTENHVVIDTEQLIEASAPGEAGQSEDARYDKSKGFKSVIQELNSTLNTMIGSIKEARGLFGGAKASTNEGLKSAQNLSEAINKFKASVDETANIAKTIDELAIKLPRDPRGEA